MTPGRDEHGVIKLECQGDGLELDKAVKVDHKPIVITLDIDPQDCPNKEVDPGILRKV